MSNMNNAEQHARKIVAVFAENHVPVGEYLMPDNIQFYLSADGLDADAVSAGLAYGEKHGWFQAGPNGSIMLTHETPLEH